MVEFEIRLNDNKVAIDPYKIHAVLFDVAGNDVIIYLENAQFHVVGTYEEVCTAIARGRNE